MLLPLQKTQVTTSKGAELEMAAMPLQGLQADYNFGYTNAKYKSLRVSQNGETVNLDGKKQIFTPEITSALALNTAMHCIKTNLNSLPGVNGFIGN